MDVSHNKVIQICFVALLLSAVISVTGCKVGGSAVQGSVGDNDTIANPVVGETKATNFDAVSISWSQEIRRALVSYNEGTTAPPNCSSGTLATATPTTDHQVSISGLKDDTIYSFRICSVGASDPNKELGFAQGSVRTRTLAGKLSGRSHFCQVVKNAKIRCWGYGGNGQLATGDRQTRLYEVESSMFADVVQVAGGYYQTCVLLGDTSVRCVGAGVYGLPGDGTTNLLYTPTSPIGLESGVKQISAGPEHDCVVMLDGTVRCWGHGLYGRLGDANLVEHTTATATAVPGLTDIKEIAAAYQVTCALKNDGSVVCFGRCSIGLCGAVSADSGTPVAVTLEAPAVSISAGEGHMCALLNTGTVWCWGLNTNGRLGNNSTVNSATPVLAIGISSAVQISVGSYMTCARLSDGGVKCWGLAGTVGDLSIADRLVPTDVPGVTGAKWIASGYKATCAILSDNSTKCWGQNVDGNIGDGNYSVSLYAPTTKVVVEGCKIRIRAGEDTTTANQLTVPTGCKRLRLAAWGGGGGGGATVGGGRGGFGGYITDEYAIQAGDTFYFTLGRGGATAVSTETPLGGYSIFFGGNGGTGPGGTLPGTGAGVNGIGGGSGGSTLTPVTAQSGSQGYMGGGGGGGTLVSSVRYAGGGGGGGGATQLYFQRSTAALGTVVISVAGGGGGGGAFGSAASGVSPDGGSGCSQNGASPSVANAGGGGGGGRCIGTTLVSPATAIFYSGLSFGAPGAGGTSRSAGANGGLVIELD